MKKFSDWLKEDAEVGNTNLADGVAKTDNPLKIKPATRKQLQLKPPVAAIASKVAKSA